MASSPDPLLVRVGAAVRARRSELNLSRRELSATSGVSERFLAQLERGDGNISLRRFAELARALDTNPVALLTAGDPAPARPIALLGVRGAGKSTIGAALADQLAVPFVELDQLIERAAGLPLGELFALHGETYYRRIEREVLASVLGDHETRVVATGGSIVNDPINFQLLQSQCRTVWLRARPIDHWNRVIAQGDRRPMAENPHAFAELRALLAAREPLYARADHVIDTSRRSIAAVVAAVCSATAQRRSRRLSTS